MSTEKNILHPRNKHRARYDFNVLKASCPELSSFVAINSYGDESIDFANSEAVKILNKALLKHFYKIDHWDIPPQFLCPPIPGRVDYMHYTADLLAESNASNVPMGISVRVLDIGAGANFIYPLLGHKEYGWRFVGSDIDQEAIRSAQRIIGANPNLDDVLECRFQNFKDTIFRGIIKPGETFDLTVCNPPFHSSEEEAIAGTQRKWNNLGRKQSGKPKLNFGGQQSELWCEGGERAFIQKMVNQSKEYARSCLWFSSLVSKKENLPAIYWSLKQMEAVDVKTLQMSQGQKTSRMVAWTFYNEPERKEWARKRWTKR